MHKKFFGDVACDIATNSLHCGASRNNLRYSRKMSRAAKKIFHRNEKISRATKKLQVSQILPHTTMQIDCTALAALA